MSCLHCAWIVFFSLTLDRFLFIACCAFSSSCFVHPSLFLIFPLPTSCRSTRHRRRRRRHQPQRRRCLAEFLSWLTDLSSTWSCWRYLPTAWPWLSTRRILTGIPTTRMPFWWVLQLLRNIQLIFSHTQLLHEWLKWKKTNILPKESFLMQT
jgi:hypothetical protein